MAEPLRIALAGLGTVGIGVIELLETNRSTIERRAGRELQIVAVNARDRSRDRGVDLSRYVWVDDMQAMAERGDVDVVLELVGGSDGPALTLARAALDAGKGFVTANKAMIAHHGLALAEQAALRGVPLKFQPCVAFHGAPSTRRPLSYSSVSAGGKTQKTPALNGEVRSE